MSSLHRWQRRAQSGKRVSLVIDEARDCFGDFALCLFCGRLALDPDGKAQVILMSARMPQNMLAELGAQAVFSSLPSFASKRQRTADG